MDQADTPTLPSWFSKFPGLAVLEPDVQTVLAERSQLVRHKAGTLLFGQGKEAQSLLLLTEGTVRVQKVSDGGREIILYRVSGGESCILTSACLLAYEMPAAEGYAETDIEAVAIPRLVFEELISTSPGFRQFVFAAYAKRLTDLFLVIDEVAFQRVDMRLTQKLLERADTNDQVRATHQDLATEIGSAREVISRQLQEFQRRGWVRLARGTIALIDRPALARFAGS